MSLDLRGSKIHQGIDNKMKRFQPMLIIVGISLLTLVGCNGGEQASTNTPAATPETSLAAGKFTQGNNGLLAVVAKTKTAVTSGNFVQAKKEFDKFEDFWKEVEDGIKTKSPKNYDAIEKSSDEITGELKESKPQKQKLLSELQLLEKSITAVSKS